ncbi:hypothetical protein STRAU_0602 [Streptomyces aurantiacus JA 4570]|uniref:Uncharacterized protein n=1 Tax=Streptomyces aurantiacus JA 4570 TaxID=1286094 RepID=S4AY93_9ACTN|nr:hypothetical protein STRAU_0602 [Streptomyces aurantiacus JA 4570]
MTRQVLLFPGMLRRMRVGTGAPVPVPAGADRYPEYASRSKRCPTRRTRRTRPGHSP